jgi:hypothetical protein
MRAVSLRSLLEASLQREESVNEEPVCVSPRSCVRAHEICMYIGWSVGAWHIVSACTHIQERHTRAHVPEIKWCIRSSVLHVSDAASCEKKQVPPVK